MDARQHTELPRDVVVAFLNQLAPGSVFSEEARENIRLFSSQVLKNLCELAVASSQSQHKSIVDTNDFSVALERLNLASVFRAFGISNSMYNFPTLSSIFNQYLGPQKEIQLCPKLLFRALIRSVSASPSASLPTSAYTPASPKRSHMRLIDNSGATESRKKDDGEEEKQLSLFKKNGGHSRYVRERLANQPNMTFGATMGSASILKRIMEAIKESCSQAEVNFDVTAAGIDIQALGPSHVSLVDLKLKASGFDWFHCQYETSLGIHISGLHSFLKQVSRNDQISILFTEGSRECCFILEDGQRSVTFEMKLKKMESHPLAITEVEYGSEWVLASASFVRICRDLKTSMTGENVHITVSQDADGTAKLSFASTGVYGGIKIACEKEMALCIKKSSVEAEASPLSGNVELKFGHNCPLMCGYEIDNFGHLRYFLAPKISDTSK